MLATAAGKTTINVAREVRLLRGNPTPCIGAASA